MIKPSYDPFRRNLWKGFIHFNQKRAFRKLILPHKVEADPERSLLLLTNHVSWWDGFWGFYLNEQEWNKRFQVIMLERELAPRKFLRHAGAFSIDPQSRSMIESLRYSAELLEDPQNMLLLFPQGKIWSFHNDKIDFGTAPAKILKWCRKPVQVVFGAVFVDFFQYHKPSLYYYLKEWDQEEEIGLVYQDFFRECLEEQSKRWV
ncbi:MAG: 1-acyl-sn-glycerol-3-phosphate acyltransferase [Bacteroidia bacterium]|nr:1-acyl-sn-glycerol-3-phosphate acyltransferase [Bacteroidia bacterium]